MRDATTAPRASRRYGVDRSNGATVVYPVPGQAGLPPDATPSDVTRAGRVWPRALRPALSPCRIDAGKGLQQHRCSAHHAALVESYRLARQAYEEAEELVTSGYAAEERDARRQHGSSSDAPTFGRWLQGYRESA